MRGWVPRAAVDAPENTRSKFNYLDCTPNIRRWAGFACPRVRERSRLRARFSMFSSLPNVHPFLVHFPIALFTAALVGDLSLVAGFRHLWVDRAALLGLGASALSSFATAWSGKLASDSLTPT